MGCISSTPLGLQAASLIVTLAFITCFSRTFLKTFQTVGLGVVSTKSIIKIICEDGQIVLYTILTTYLNFSITLIHTPVYKIACTLVGRGQYNNCCWEGASLLSPGLVETLVKSSSS